MFQIHVSYRLFVDREHRLGSWLCVGVQRLLAVQTWLGPATHPTRMTDHSKHTKPDIPERTHTQKHQTNSVHSAQKMCQTNTASPD